MPSSEKTPALGLNRWRGSDIPMREDFVADNNILDTVIAALQAGGGSSGNDPRLDTHIADANVHLSAADRESLNNAGGPVIGSYNGDGALMQTIVLGFRPRFGFVFAAGRALVEPGSNGLFQLSRAGFVTNVGATRGLDTSSIGFMALQNVQGTTTGADMHGLNQQDVRYVYVVWR